MFSKALQDMTDTDWSLFPSNTNAVESQNKLSQIHTNKFLTVVRQFYTTEKNCIYKTLAAANGIGAGPSQAKRKTINAQRQSNRRTKRAKLKGNQKCTSEEPEEEEEEDPFIGKSICVYTKASRGSKFTWRQAKVELKNPDGSYMVNYCNGNTAFVKDLLNKEKVKFPSVMDDEA